MKFKVGDKVKIIKNSAGHNYPIGSTVKITYADSMYCKAINPLTAALGNNFYHTDAELYDDRFEKSLIESFLTDDAQELVKAGILQVSIELVPESRDFLLIHYALEKKDVLLASFRKILRKKK